MEAYLITALGVSIIADTQESVLSWIDFINDMHPHAVVSVEKRQMIGKVLNWQS